MNPEFASLITNAELQKALIIGGVLVAGLGSLYFGSWLAGRMDRRYYGPHAGETFDADTHRRARNTHRSGPLNPTTKKLK